MFRICGLKWEHRACEFFTHTHIFCTFIHKHVSHNHRFLISFCHTIIIFLARCCCCYYSTHIHIVPFSSLFLSHILVRSCLKHEKKGNEWEIHCYADREAAVRKEFIRETIFLIEKKLPLWSCLSRPLQAGANMCRIWISFDANEIEKKNVQRTISDN